MYPFNKNEMCPTYNLLSIATVVNTGNVFFGDGFMDFIHRPKIKILKIKKVKNKNHDVSEAGSSSILHSPED
jgi:hypothetical protein